jgi:hypothetical protein
MKKFTAWNWPGNIREWRMECPAFSVPALRQTGMEGAGPTQSVGLGIQQRVQRLLHRAADHFIQMRRDPAFVDLNHRVQTPHSSTLLLLVHLASVPWGLHISPMFYQPEFLNSNVRKKA